MDVGIGEEGASGLGAEVSLSFVLRASCSIAFLTRRPRTTTTTSTSTIRKFARLNRPRRRRSCSFSSPPAERGRGRPRARSGNFPRFNRARRRPSCSLFFTASGPRTRTTTSTIRKFARLNRRRGRPSCSFSSPAAERGRGRPRARSRNSRVLIVLVVDLRARFSSPPADRGRGRPGRPRARSGNFPRLDRPRRFRREKKRERRSNHCCWCRRSGARRRGRQRFTGETKTGPACEEFYAMAGIPKRSFGKTNDQISALGLGGHHLGDAEGRNNCGADCPRSDRRGNHLLRQLLGIQSEASRRIGWAEA